MLYPFKLLEQSAVKDIGCSIIGHYGDQHPVQK